MHTPPPVSLPVFSTGVALRPLSPGAGGGVRNTGSGASGGAPPGGASHAARTVRMPAYALTQRLRHHFYPDSAHELHPKTTGGPPSTTL